jgi:hypothetical protein
VASEVILSKRQRMRMVGSKRQRKTRRVWDKATPLQQYDEAVAELGRIEQNMLAELTTKKRKALRKSTFAIPEKSPGSGSYPIPDLAHARNALARVSQHGTPQEKARVRAAVARKFPGIGQKKRKK